MKISGAFLFMVFIGILSLAAGVVNYMQEEAFFATAEHATATISEYIPDPNPKAAGFCPRYHFTTSAGQKVVYTGDNCVSKPDPSQIGQPEEVYYDSKDPQTVESRGWLGSEGSGLIMGAAGCVFFPLIGSISLLSDFLKKRKAAKA
jgi:hypothetical protein